MALFCILISGLREVNAKVNAKPFCFFATWKHFADFAFGLGDERAETGERKQIGGGILICVCGGSEMLKRRKQTFALQTRVSKHLCGFRV